MSYYLFYAIEIKVEKVNKNSTRRFIFFYLVILRHGLRNSTASISSLPLR